MNTADLLKKITQFATVHAELDVHAIYGGQGQRWMVDLQTLLDHIGDIVTTETALACDVVEQWAEEAQRAIPIDAP